MLDFLIFEYSRLKYFWTLWILGKKINGDRFTFVGLSEFVATDLKNLMPTIMDSESLPKTEAAVELPKFNIKTKVDLSSTLRKVRLLHTVWKSPKKVSFYNFKHMRHFLGIFKHCFLSCFSFLHAYLFFSLDKRIGSHAFWRCQFFTNDYNTCESRWNKSHGKSFFAKKILHWTQL